MERALESFTKWNKDSGLSVNSFKTDTCVFRKYEMRPVLVKVGQSSISTQNVINVLGVQFDSRLQWFQQVAKAIKKQTKLLVRSSQ
jgi:hypothetical protein